MSSVESQKGAIIIQICSVDNQKFNLSDIRSIGPSVYRTLSNNRSIGLFSIIGLSDPRSIGPSVYRDSPEFSGLYWLVKASKICTFICVNNRKQQEICPWKFYLFIIFFLANSMSPHVFWTLINAEYDWGGLSLLSCMQRCHISGNFRISGNFQKEGSFFLFFVVVDYSMTISTQYSIKHRNNV